VPVMKPHNDADMFSTSATQTPWISGLEFSVCRPWLLRIEDEVVLQNSVLDKPRSISRMVGSLHTLPLT
jgi:hypothetical protein